MGILSFTTEGFLGNFPFYDTHHIVTVLLLLGSLTAK